MRDVVDGTNNMATCSVQRGNGKFIPVHELGTQSPRRERGTQLLESFNSLVDGRPLARICLRHVLDKWFHEVQTEALLHEMFSMTCVISCVMSPTFMYRVLIMFPRWYTSMGNGLYVLERCDPRQC